MYSIKKTNDLILKKDGQTDESNFIGRCPTNVECPIGCLKYRKKLQCCHVNLIRATVLFFDLENNRKLEVFSCFVEMQNETSDTRCVNGHC